MKMREQNIAELELQLEAEADKRDLTFAKNYNGYTYALMDVDWIGYFNTIDEICDFLGVE